MKFIYIAAHIVHTVLCAFVKVIPSPPVLIIKPKKNLNQFFQVFSDYKVLIQLLTMQPNSCIVHKQH